MTYEQLKEKYPRLRRHAWCSPLTEEEKALYEAGYEVGELVRRGCTSSNLEYRLPYEDE